MLVPAVRLYFVRLPPISYFSLPYWISSSWRIGSVPEHQMRVPLSCCLKAFTSLHRICHRARAPSLAMRVETGKHQFRRARNGLEIAACATEDRPPPVMSRPVDSRRDAIFCCSNCATSCYNEGGTVWPA